LIGMTDIKHRTLEESIDIWFDTVFAVIGFLIVKKFISEV
jgi:hypothetical protein